MGGYPYPGGYSGQTIAEGVAQGATRLPNASKAVVELVVGAAS